MGIENNLQMKKKDYFRISFVRIQYMCNKILEVRNLVVWRSKNRHIMDYYRLFVCKRIFYVIKKKCHEKIQHLKQPLKMRLKPFITQTIITGTQLLISGHTLQRGTHPLIKKEMI